MEYGRNIPEDKIDYENINLIKIINVIYSNFEYNKIRNNLIEYISNRKSFYLSYKKKYQSELITILTENSYDSEMALSQIIFKFSREIMAIESGLYETRNDKIDAFK